MKHVNKILFLILLFAVFACNSAEKKASEQVVQDFYKALKTEDSLQIKKYYPAFEKLGGFYKSDKITIKEVSVLENQKYSVTIQNFFKNIKNKKFEQEITFICQKDKNDNMIIVDSKGIYGFDETREYNFAVQTGFIPKKNQLTDQEIAAKILKSQELLELLFKEKIESLRKEVAVENWGWEYGYDNTHANGHGKVVNNSNEDFSTLKYTLTFVAADGNVTKTDEGYLIYDKLKSGESKDFTTMSSQIGNAVKAYIQIQFETYELLEQIYKGKYSGNEFHLVK
jgi:hypothetical protein